MVGNQEEERKCVLTLISNQPKATQVSQFDLMFHKDSNWKIVG